VEEYSWLDERQPRGAGTPLVAAKASHAVGHGAEGASRDIAAAYELDAAASASTILAALPVTVEGSGGAVDDARALEVRDLYNAALEDLLRMTGGRRIRPDARWRDRLAAVGVTLARPEPGDDSVWDPGRFDQLLFARDFAVRGIEQPSRTEGVGVPMIAVRGLELNKRDHHEGQEGFLMPREVYAVTAILRVVSATGRTGPPEYRLELRDPLAARPVEPVGPRQPLATDFTTPLAYHLARSPLPILQEVGLLDPGWLEALEGLYLLHPYQPGKIPVVFVHGLRSSPLAWLKVINAIYGDPILRERYQVWLYMYPTGGPVPSTSAKLREDLDALRRAIDPERADPMLDRMVVVGHSMGGLISKMMILESGDAIWRLFSQRSFDELRASPERREALRRALFFSPHPSVARVVFIATPHRGSALGDELIGQITDRLIRMPRHLRSAYRDLISSNDRGFFTPTFQHGIPTSIDELRFDNPFLVTLSRLPRADVPTHSIIGRKHPDVPLELSNDGVVPYRSSHIDWARSERVVAGDHGCQDIPETIAEIRRILALHLAEAAPDPILRP
jgi:pimeloyl-ACP methyl ester carboxylesterase